MSAIGFDWSAGRDMSALDNLGADQSEALGGEIFASTGNKTFNLPESKATNYALIGVVAFVFFKLLEKK